jgi:PhnB protein
MNTTTMQLNPYLSFNGQCEAAFRFYERCLGGKIECIMTYASKSAEYQVPDEWRQKILHVTLRVGDHVLMGADAPPDRYQKPQGFSLTLGLKDQAEADRIFNALAEKGTVEMALQETFWAVRFGVVVDRFGIPWTIKCERPACVDAASDQGHYR